MVWFRQFGQCLCQRWLCYHMNVRLNCQGSLSLILRMLIFMPTKYKCSLCSSFLPSTHQPCSLVSFSHGLSAMVQCFSLTTNQYQPGLSAQKPTNEQADHHFFWFSIYFLSITCSDYFLPVTEKQFTHFRRREALLCGFVGSDQQQQLASSLFTDTWSSWSNTGRCVNIFGIPLYVD